MRPFVLEGGAFVRTDRGGFHEWTVRYDDGAIAYLVEAAGSLALYEETPLVPPLATCLPGTAALSDWVVVERGEASRGPYVELSSRAGRRATIDYGTSPPRTFVGAGVSASALGVALPPPRFFAVDETARPRDAEVLLPVGDAIDLDGVGVRVLGLVRREGAASWDEYAIYDPTAGVRWLVLADGHWSLAESVEPGLVHVQDDAATYAGERFTDPHPTVARIVWATGELPWLVRLGDEAALCEWQGSDATLTSERTSTSLAWTRSRPLPPDVIARAVGKRALPKPTIT